MAPIAHLLAGSIGSGKTTFARSLEQATNAVRYSYDEWMIRHHGHNPPEHLFAKFFVEIEEMIWAEAGQQLRSGKDVIEEFVRVDGAK